MMLSESDRKPKALMRPRQAASRAWDPLRTPDDARRRRLPALRTQARGYERATPERLHDHFIDATGALHVADDRDRELDRLDRDGL